MLAAVVRLATALGRQSSAPIALALAGAVPYYEAVPGHTIDLGGGARLQVLSAPREDADPNEGSVVIKLTMGLAWRDLAMREGFREAIRRRDEPWGDYSARKRT